MSIETLKAKARKHEQKEEWRKALDQYQQAIATLVEEGQPDIGLYNRVGDLFVKVGDLDEAVESYEQSVGLYVDADLHNNAIAVCKKIIRHVPERHAAYLRMGQIRAQQGFLPDARTNFLLYAEKMQQEGDLDESFRALVEFCDLAPDDVEVRLAVAEQMASHGSTEDAVAQYTTAHQALMAKGDADTAAGIESKIRELDPTAQLDAAAPVGVGAPDEATFGTDTDTEPESESEGFSLESGDDDAGAGVEIADFDIAAPTDEAPEEEAPEEEAAVGAPEDAEGMLDLPMIGFGAEDGEDAEEAGELPMMGFDAEGEKDAPADELSTAGFAEEADEGEAADELPMMEFGAEGDDEEAAEELPMMGFGADEAEPPEEAGALVTDEVSAEAVPTSVGDDLPTTGFDTVEVDAPDDAPAPDEEEDAEAEAVLDAAAFGVSDAPDRAVGEYVSGEEEMAEVDVGLAEIESDAAREAAIEEAVADDASVDGVRARIEGAPDDVGLRQRLVELAYEGGDEGTLVEAYLGLGQTLDRVGETDRARVAYQQVLQLDPANEAAAAGLGDDEAAVPATEVAATEDYVDLGSMILGDDDEEEKSTRFVVDYQEPSGDEAADFAQMLSQFKEKVSENLDADDVKAHYDLGTAYKEMGLLDEAVGEFQQALRASADHLATYEMLGQTFMEMGQPDAAVKSLERALQVPHDIEDELVGIYYYLARALEELGQATRAVDYYDRVFALDINFADVTERLRALRPS